MKNSPHCLHFSYLAMTGENSQRPTAPVSRHHRLTDPAKALCTHKVLHKCSVHMICHGNPVVGRQGVFEHCFRSDTAVGGPHPNDEKDHRIHPCSRSDSHVTKSNSNPNVHNSGADVMTQARSRRCHQHKIST